MSKSNDARTQVSSAAESQAQSASAEKAQRAQTPEKAAAAEGEIQFFDGTIVKIDAQGREVMSDHLAPGEKLRRETTDRYTHSSSNANDDYRAKRDQEGTEAKVAARAKAKDNTNK